MDKKILLFGYGNHGRSIAKSLKDDGFYVDIVVSIEENEQNFLKHEFENMYRIDITDDDELEKLSIDSYAKIVCVMDDEHHNVFLTLSLKSLYKNAFIIAISDSIYTTQKLKMAGADNVIDLYEVSANRVHNILTKPTATRILDGFLNHQKGIHFKEIFIPKDSFLDGKNTNDLDISKYNILLVGMVDQELGSDFIFITTGINHKLDSGDTIVCLGTVDSLDLFTQIVAQNKEP